MGIDAMAFCMDINISLPFEVICHKLQETINIGEAQRDSTLMKKVSEVCVYDVTEEFRCYVY